MIARARERLPDAEFEVMDAWDLPKGFDLIFSNACIQWIDGQERLIPMMLERLNPGGTLAVQVPMNEDEPASVICEEVASLPLWHYPNGRPRRHRTLSPEKYYDILSGCAESFEMWSVTYYHALESHSDIVEWKIGTHLRPYLEALDATEGLRLKEEVLRRVKEAYAPASDGKVVMRYGRFFFTATG